MSGGGKTTVQKSDPWSGQQPFLRDIYNSAQSLYRYNQPEYFPGQTYVGPSDQTQAGLGMMQDRAMGSPVESTMQDYIMGSLTNPGGQGTQDFLSGVMGSQPTFGQSQGMVGGMGNVPSQALTATASGDFLNSNPYLDNMFSNASRAVTEQFNDAVLPGLNATFAGAGGSGSQIQRELAMDAAGELGDSLSGMAANIYGNNYQTERGRQLQAAGQLSADDLSRTGMAMDLFNQGQSRGLGAAGLSTDLLGTQGQISGRAAALAPTASSLDWQNINNMLQAGQITEGYQMQPIQEAMNRWNFEQQAPWNSLAQYASAVQGAGVIPGEQSTTTPGGSPLAGMAGGAMMGGALSSMPALSFLGPWGMLGGAVLGGLLS